jgi:hypothetical protein
MPELSMQLKPMPAVWKESPRGWLWSEWTCPMCGENLSYINQVDDGLAVLHLKDFVKTKSGIFKRPKAFRTGHKSVRKFGTTCLVKSDDLPITVKCCGCSRYVTINSIRG